MIYPNVSFLLTCSYLLIYLNIQGSRETIHGSNETWFHRVDTSSTFDTETHDLTTCYMASLVLLLVSFLDICQYLLTLLSLLSLSSFSFIPIIQILVKVKDIKEAKAFNLTIRNIDDILSIKISKPC